MKIEDRIANIKKILPYCSHWDRDVVIYDETVGEFFGNFFNNPEDDRFYHCSYKDKIYPKIQLATHILTRDENDNVIDEYPIDISYCYNFDRDGEEWVTYYFDEPLTRNHWLFETEKDFIRYEEIPDNIWQIIQDKLYENAAKTKKKELDEAERLLTNRKEEKENFENIVLVK